MVPDVLQLSLMWQWDFYFSIGCNCYTMVAACPSSSGFEPGVYMPNFSLLPLNPHLLSNVFLPHQSRHCLQFVTLWHLCVFVDKVGHTGMMGPPGNGTLVHNPEYGEGMLWDPDWQAREAHMVLGPEWLWAGQKWLLHIGVLMSMTCLALGKYTCWSSKPPVDGMGILNYMDGVMVDGRTTLPLLAGLLKNVRTCMSLSGRSVTNCLRVGGADGI